MANIGVSNACNLGCSYCFAGPHMAATAPPDRFISLADFDDRLEFLANAPRDLGSIREQRTPRLLVRAGDRPQVPAWAGLRRPTAAFLDRPDVASRLRELEDENRRMKSAAGIARQKYDP